MDMDSGAKNRPATATAGPCSAFGWAEAMPWECPRRGRTVDTRELAPVAQGVGIVTRATDPPREGGVYL